MNKIPNPNIDLFYEGQDSKLFSKVTGKSLNAPFLKLLENQQAILKLLDASENLSNSVKTSMENIQSSITQQIKALGSNIVLEGATKQSWLVEASMSEGYAEMTRGIGASGLFNLRQYTYDIPFNPDYRVFDVGYAAVGQHDHPNYEGMPGSAEYSAIVNGYYVRSRHNDYRLVRPANAPATYLATAINPTPPVPASVLALPTGCNADGSVDVTSNTQAKYMKNVKTSNPADCIWELAYMEVWLESFASALADPFDSFRHSIDANTIEDALEKAIYLNAGGHKNQLENIPFFPTMVRTVNEEGYPILATVKYRVISFPVSTLAETPFDEAKSILGTLDTTNKFQLVRDLSVKKRFGYTNWTTLARNRTARFRLTNGLLEALCAKVPGMDGMGANSVESYTQYGLQDTLTNYGSTTVKNASYYNHSYSTINKDASGRSNSHRGFNDPNLFVAKTTHAKVVNGFTYMIPLEMILRTPVESWNPYNVVSKAVTGDGRTVATPLSGWNYNLYNFKIPSAIFSADGLPSDAADTYKTAFVTTPAHGVQNLKASGINAFTYDGTRQRFPVYATWHEFTKGAVESKLQQDILKDVLKKMVSGTATVADIENLL